MAWLYASSVKKLWPDYYSQNTSLCSGKQSGMQFFKRSFPPHWPEASNKQTMDGSSLLIVGDKIYVFNISSVVEFRWWWVLESKIFTQESTCSKENLLKILLMNDNSSKSTKIVLWMLTFYVKKLFSSFNFGTPLFSKIMPNFWRTVIHQQNFFFSFKCVESWPKI